MVLDFLRQYSALLTADPGAFVTIFILGVLAAALFSRRQHQIREERIKQLQEQLAQKSLPASPLNKDTTDNVIGSDQRIDVKSVPIVQTSGNPLKDAIDAFLAKDGRKADYGLQATVALRDDSDGRGPYIGAWDASSLGPWPTTADGFTEQQLKRLPLAPGKFRSQSAKDRLANALDEMTVLLNASNNEIVKAYEKFHRAWVTQSNSLRTGKVDAAMMLDSLQEITTALMMMHRALYAEDGLLQKREIDAEELNSILKQDRDNNAGTSVGHAASRLRDGISVLDSIGHPLSLETMMLRVLPHTHSEYDLEMQKFLRWVKECKERADMLRSALG